MSWGDYMFAVGGLSGLATVVGLFVAACRYDILDAAAYTIAFPGLLVWVGIGSLSRFDSDFVAREKQEQIDRAQQAAELQRKNERATEARLAYMEQLKKDGLYELWHFIKTNKVPERFLRAPAEKK